MRSRIIRFTMLSVAAGLALAAMTACFFGGGEEPTPEPTPDLQATIAAAVTRSVPAATPTPEPTAAPTPDLQATLEAMLAATAAAMPTPTAAPTATTSPTSTPPPAPTSAPGPSDIPCIITGKVTVGGKTAQENTVVLARSQEPAKAGNVQTQTDEDGEYVLTIFSYGVVFDLLVDGVDTNEDTPQNQKGCLPKLINLSR